jgi:transposase
MKENIKKVFIFDNEPGKGSYKLSTSEVADICSRLENNESVSDISKMYDVNRETIYKILRGETYGNISSNYNLSNYNQYSTPISKVHEICRLLEEGKSSKEIVNETGIGRFVVERIKNGEKYTDISKDYLFSSKKSKESNMSEYEVRKICLAFSNGKRIKEVSDMLGIKYCTAQNIYLRRSYTSISKDYNW